LEFKDVRAHITNSKEERVRFTLVSKIKCRRRQTAWVSSWIRRKGEMLIENNPLRKRRGIGPKEIEEIVEEGILSRVGIGN